MFHSEPMLPHSEMWRMSAYYAFFDHEIYKDTKIKIKHYCVKRNFEFSNIKQVYL